ncbi:DUF721 domain-containing protein [Phytomonospora endophytica]|uniref:Putative nucleic acid-binding Zn ribbon protein n=1 Tax=Phytomonospora endophytica TaxID=714109 RepID=A0A841FQW1_9ACTN|nr:DciA family protein [Phytomonospora endophytica]MBB6038456.1 putative nucleic acid-binding Zn ribbon protein [Phytomonospora endophytica]GIG64385.1 hypothetical protein Pen01_06800 [Phytomonospora endophytica]
MTTGEGIAVSREQGMPYRPRRKSAGYTGPGPDKRDPQPLASLLAKLLKDRGWQQPAAHHGVFGRWEAIVGAEIAAHCRPVSLAETELVVEAESTAWATQLRLFQGTILKKIAEDLGHGLVTRVRVHGPTQTRRNLGPRRVRFPGSRDTYG